MSKGARDWHSFYMSWFQLHGPLLIVLYKDLIKDPEKELRKMIRFLGFSETRIHCAIDRVPMKTHSLMSPAKVREIFTLKQIKEIEQFRPNVFAIAKAIRQLPVD